MRAVLRHYGRERPPGATKSQLMERIITIAYDHGLEDSDYRQMYLAYWATEYPQSSWPSPKPAVVRDATNTPGSVVQSSLILKSKDDVSSVSASENPPLWPSLGF